MTLTLPFKNHRLFFPKSEISSPTWIFWPQRRGHQEENLSHSVRGETLQPGNKSLKNLPGIYCASNSPTDVEMLQSITPPAYHCHKLNQQNIFPTKAPTDWTKWVLLCFYVMIRWRWSWNLKAVYWLWGSHTQTAFGLGLTQMLGYPVVNSAWASWSLCNSNTLFIPQDETCCPVSVCSTITKALKKFDIFFWSMVIPAKSLFFHWKSSKVINLAELFCHRLSESSCLKAKYRKQSSKFVILLKCSKNSKTKGILISMA